MLSDHAIAAAVADGELAIDPFNRALVQPASIDLTLGGEFLTLHPEHVGFIDPAVDQTEVLYQRTEAKDGHFFIHPGEFVIATTVEWLRLGRGLLGRLEGKSSLGRMGLLVHSTAGFFDPGFEGQATLEIANVAGTAIKLYVGMPICQMAFDRLDTMPHSTYKGKYQMQRGPQPSRYYKNFEPGGYMEGHGG